MINLIRKQMNKAAYYLQQSDIADDKVIKERYYKMYRVEKNKLDTIKNMLEY